MKDGSAEPLVQPPVKDEGVRLSELPTYDMLYRHPFPPGLGVRVFWAK